MTALDVDTSTIKHLDFSPALPCEHSRHRDPDEPDAPPADWVRRSRCPACAADYVDLICNPCRQHLSVGFVRDNTGCGLYILAEDWINLWTPIGDAS